MLPVMQSRTGANGNCMEASLASLLELPLDAVPDLGTNAQWLPRLADFLAGRGLYYILVAPLDPEEQHILTPMFARGDVYKQVNPRGYARNSCNQVSHCATTEVEPRELDFSSLSEYF